MELNVIDRAHDARLARNLRESQRIKRYNISATRTKCDIDCQWYNVGGDVYSEEFEGPPPMGSYRLPVKALLRTGGGAQATAVSQA